jgi:L-threonylcarbamoyladenylate synthase
MDQEIETTLQILRRGGVILYPTDTVWGIGCDATSAEAVAKIYKIKQRSDTKSMLILLDTEEKLSDYVETVPDIAYDLLAMADKPLTVIYDNAVNLASNLVADDGSIGIRIPNDAFCKKLIWKLKRPLVSTSANISGLPTPALFSEISEEIKQSVDYIVNWRQSDKTKAAPSGIIKLGAKGEVKVIRQ